ncbi:hypothetical protein A7K94_0215270 [Modestobacter sp. VKM Ac-2676]|nr:hypothetical protein A7K94_0215270 [Modestobacter sp. VKM Ac-2676]
MLRFGRWVRGPEFFTVAASLAFYAMISIPPMVLIAFWIAGAFVDDPTLEGLGSQVDGQTPDQLPVGEVLRALIDIAARAGPVAVVSAAWPATAYGAALARAFTQVAPESERRIRGWRGRLLALVLIAVLPLVVFSALAALYVVPRLFGTGWALTALLGLGAFTVLALVIALVYALFQLRDTRWQDVAVGALIAAGLVALTTAGYLVYLEFFADFSDRYGTSSLATAVLLGLWLLLGNAVLLVGYRLMLRRAIRRQERHR